MIRSIGTRQYPSFRSDIDGYANAEMDGIQATRAIRQLKKIKQPLILAMTANVSEEDRKACMDAGMDDFISKPIKLDVLREILRKCLLEG